MIFGNLILVAIPLIIGAVGAFCAAKEQKMLFGLICGAVVCFVAAVCAADSRRLELLSMMTGNLPISSLGDIETPPAYLLLLRICLRTGIGAQDFIIFHAALQGVLTAVYVCGRQDVPYAGAAVFAACFLPLVCIDPNILTAVLLCLFSAKYIEERRFFRFAAFIFAAACFDISVLILLPVWFIALIPKNWITAPLAAGIAVLAVYFPEACAEISRFLGADLFVRRITPMPLAICSVAVALLLMLTAAMFRNRSESTARLIPVFITGAALSFAGVYEAALFVPSQAALAMAAAALAPDGFTIGRRFATIMFPGNKKAADITVIVLFAAAGTALCAYIVFGGLFGTSCFGAHLFGEVSG